jgi:ribonuclease III
MSVTNELRERAEKILGYNFQSANLLKEALTHASIADNRLNSNERMEFLGDAVLDLIVCEALYLKFPEYLEGDLTKVKSAVVSRRTCAEVSKETGLIDLLITGKGISVKEAMPSSLAAAVYESIVAAIYLDGGFEVVKEYVLRTMTPKINVIASNTHQENYKALLQQHAQKMMGATPIYELLDEKGPDHSKCFEVCVAVDGRRFTSAWGPNKKMAEQKAALLALEELGVLDPKEVDQAIEEIAIEPEEQKE